MDFGKSLVNIIAVVLAIGSPTFLLALVLWYKSRKTRLIHETAIRLAEKGQQVPPALFLGGDQPSSDLRRGVVLVGLGLGLALFMYQMDMPWSIGLIPFFMGIGYLVVWKLESGRTGTGG